MNFSRNLYLAVLFAIFILSSQDSQAIGGTNNVEFWILFIFDPILSNFTVFLFSFETNAVAGEHFCGLNFGSKHNSAILLKFDS